MVSTLEQILKKEFPDRKNCYYELLVNSIEELSQIQFLLDNDDQKKGSSKSDGEEPWRCGEWDAIPEGNLEQQRVDAFSRRERASILGQ